MKNTRYYSSLSTRYQYGFSLVEILVALILSLLLVAGVIQLFIGSKQTYRFHDAASRLQENGRLALDAMAIDIRMADYRPQPLPPIPPNQLPQIPVGSNGNDITLQWLDPLQCTPANGVCSQNYSIGPRPVGSPVPACPSAATSLRLNRNGGGAQEFVEGVESMQILYGVCNTDADGDGRNDSVTTPPGYINAATVTVNNQWLNVCSVRIHLLLVSLENNIVTQPQTVFFPADTNAVWPVNDRCLRQAFSTTVAIRNRMP